MSDCTNDQEGRTSWARMDGEIVVVRSFVENRLSIGSGERLKKFLIWLRNTVVQIISRCPERISTDFR